MPLPDPPYFWLSTFTLIFLIFFYVWLSYSESAVIFIRAFSSQLTPKKKWNIMNPSYVGSNSIKPEEMMHQAFKLSRVLKIGGMMVVVFSQNYI